MIIHNKLLYFLNCYKFKFQERFHTITTSYYRGAMGILLVYDITRPTSFDNLAKWLRTILEHSNADVEKMIIGNKCDMEEQRLISKERGESIAKENGIPFLETSAKNNINVEEAFLQMSERILDKLPGSVPESSPNIVPKTSPKKRFAKRTKKAPYKKSSYKKSPTVN